MVAFIVNIALIPASIILGLVLGLALIFLIKFKYIKSLIMPIGFMTFFACDFIKSWSDSEWTYLLNFDGFLICIAAGWITGNYSTNVRRSKFISYLKSLSTLVFIPFFTQVGLGVNADTIAHTAIFSISAAAVRAFSMMVGSYIGGSMCNMDYGMKRSLWLGLLPQSGTDKITHTEYA